MTVGQKPLVLTTQLLPAHLLWLTNSEQAVYIVTLGQQPDSIGELEREPMDDVEKEKSWIYTLH